LVRFVRIPITLAFAVMAASISRGQTPSGTETGIEGVIMISPARPGPIRADSPGSIPLANATFVVENEKSEVASFTTDDHGHRHASTTNVWRQPALRLFRFMRCILVAER
jgi:hypothetical protein